MPHREGSKSNKKKKKSSSSSSAKVSSTPYHQDDSAPGADTDEDIGYPMSAEMKPASSVPDHDMADEESDEGWSDGDSHSSPTSEELERRASKKESKRATTKEKEKTEKKKDKKKKDKTKKDKTKKEKAKKEKTKKEKTKKSSSSRDLQGAAKKSTEKEEPIKMNEDELEESPFQVIPRNSPQSKTRKFPDGDVPSPRSPRSREPAMLSPSPDKKPTTYVLAAVPPPPMTGMSLDDIANSDDLIIGEDSDDDEFANSALGASLSSLHSRGSGNVREVAQALPKPAVSTEDRQQRKLSAVEESMSVAEVSVPGDSFDDASKDSTPVSPLHSPPNSPSRSPHKVSADPSSYLGYRGIDSKRKSSTQFVPVTVSPSPKGDPVGHYGSHTSVPVKDPPDAMPSVEEKFAAADDGEEDEDSDNDSFAADAGDETNVDIEEGVWPMREDLEMSEDIAPRGSSDDDSIGEVIPISKYSDRSSKHEEPDPEFSSEHREITYTPPGEEFFTRDYSQGTDFDVRPPFDAQFDNAQFSDASKPRDLSHEDDDDAPLKGAVVFHSPFDNGTDPETAQTTNGQGRTRGEDSLSLAVETQRRDRRLIWCLVIALTCTLVVLSGVVGGLLGALVFNRDSDDSASSSTDGISPRTVDTVTTTPTATPTSLRSGPPSAWPSAMPSPDPGPLVVSNYLLLAVINIAVLDVEPGEGILDHGSARNRAYRWLESSEGSNPGLVGATDERKIQRFTLAAFYFGAQGRSWTDQADWLSSSNECLWQSTDSGRIECDENGLITVLELNGNNLGGTLHVDIGLLTTLTTLSIVNEPGSGVSGTLPTTLGLLTRLNTLNLSGNSFSGAIPSTLGDLVSLTSLDLENNAFSGQVPAEIELLVSLEELNLSNNALTGAVPDLSAIAGLRELRVNGNQLAGEIANDSCGDTTYADCAEIVCTCCTYCCESDGTCIAS